MMRIRSQSILEFITLFAVIAIAIMVAHKYMYRSVNAKLKQVQEELTYSKPAD